MTSTGSGSIATTSNPRSASAFARRPVPAPTSTTSDPGPSALASGATDAAAMRDATTAPMPPISPAAGAAETSPGTGQVNPMPHTAEVHARTSPGRPPCRSCGTSSRSDAPPQRRQAMASRSGDDCTCSRYRSTTASSRPCGQQHPRRLWATGTRSLGARRSGASRSSRHHRSGWTFDEPHKGGNRANRCPAPQVHRPRYQQPRHHQGDHRHDARVLHHHGSPLSHTPVTTPIWPANSISITPSTRSSAPGTITSATTS